MRLVLILIGLFYLGCATSHNHRPILKNPNMLQLCNLFNFRPIQTFNKEPSKALAFSSGIGSEQVNCIDSIYSKINRELVRTLLFSVHLTGIKAGQKLVFSSYGEVTNEWEGSRMMWCWFTALGSSANDVKGLNISHARGFNFDYYTHHMTYADNGVYVFPKDYDDIWINVVGYTQNLDGMNFIPGILIERYGTLQGLVIE